MATVGHVLSCTPALLYFFFIMSPITSSVSDSEALLRFKKSLTDTARRLKSWKPGSAPCATGREWAGLVCHRGTIAGLHLGQMGLSGTIDVEALQQMPTLRTLSFVNNTLSGSIPEFNRMETLKAIYLSGNQFSGAIPSDFFAKMGSLKKLWLSRNNFSGEIPSSLAQLSHLIELHLENNQFSGSIPPLGQPKLVSFNLSNNNLEGEIPAGLSKFDSSSFAGNRGLCGPKLGRACDFVREKRAELNSKMKSNDGVTNSSNNHTTRMATGFMTGAVLVLSLTIVAILVFRRTHERFAVLGKENLDETVEVRVSNASKRDMSFSSQGMGSGRKAADCGKGVGDLVMVSDVKGEFGLQDLMRASAEVLGNGALGSSYKAMMSDGLTVVVKRTREMNKLHGRDGFDAEMRRLGGLRHRNVLPLLAYFYQKDEKLLVYEHIPGCSLLYLLHGERRACHIELNWPTRLKIVRGIARGLGYLHTELASMDLPHGNLKSSNVLLGSDSEPLLADYGFCTLIKSSHAAQALFAYKSPEAAQNRQASPKCDVYCLGIIILEILTGKFPSQYMNKSKGGTDVVQWVKSAISEGKELELFDQEIAWCRNSIGDMEQLLHIGAACTETKPGQRLDIREAIRRIEQIKIEGGQKDRAVQGQPSFRDGIC